MPRPATDLTMQTFGRLLAIVPYGKTKHGNVKWLCVCECGKVTSVASSELTNRRTQSCGCYKRELCAIAATIHGHRRRSPTYVSWRCVIQRCTNASANNWEYYGGANPPVKVCSEWMTFVGFLASMGERPEGTTLGRFGDVGDYEPGNCSWQTKAEQRTEAKKFYPVYEAAA